VVEQVGQGIGECVERDRRRIGEADRHRGGDDLRGVADGLPQVDRRASRVEASGVEGVAEVGGDLAEDDLVVRVGDLLRGIGQEGVREIQSGGGEGGGQPGRQIARHHRRLDAARHHLPGSW
jgi:hypothetical protein